MKYVSYLPLFLILSFGSRAQLSYTAEVDTLKSMHRTFGSFDSLSNAVKSFQALFFISPESSYLNPFALNTANRTSLNVLQVKKSPLVFSALPHVGFFYAFGAQGVQRLHVDFQQAYRHGFLLNVSYDKNKGAGFLRNDAFEFNDFNLRLIRNGNQYSSDFHAVVKSVNRAWSDGLASPNFTSGIDLNLQSVNKDNANSEQSLSDLSYEHSWDFLKDSISGFGLIAKHTLDESKRSYSEIDALTNLYAQVYWNSDTTADRFKERNFSNQLGLFLSRKDLSVQSLVHTRLRSWNDSFSARDTTEVWLENQLRYVKTNFSVYHKNAINFYGAASSFNSQSTVKCRIGKVKLLAQHIVSNELPSLMQRKYYSNNVQYALNNVQKQWNQIATVDASRKIGSFNIDAKYQLLQFKNNYLFDVLLGTWENNTIMSNGIVQSAQIGLTWDFKRIQFKPSYQWTQIINGLSFQPKNQANVHVQWKGGVFKAKKLQMLFALDANYMSSFSSLTFLPQMGVFDLLHGTSMPQNGFVNLAFTTALEVETFRFFVRVDNIGSYWVDPSTSFVQNYPFPGLQVKLGLTWDFWN